jgi:hypothetical protein
VAVTVAGTGHTTSKHKVVIPKTQVSHRNPAILGLEEKGKPLADINYNIHLKYECNFFLNCPFTFLYKTMTKTSVYRL